MKKTKAMAISRKQGGLVNIILNGERVELVLQTFCYSESWILNDGRCD